MNTTLKAVTVAVGLAIGSAASAAPIPPEGLFFTAVDQTNNTSILINLGFTTGDFRADPNAAFALAGSSLTALTGWLSSVDTSNFQWSVFGRSDDGTANNFPPSPLYGGLSTSTNIASVPQDWGSFGGLDATVQNSLTFINGANNNLQSSNVWINAGTDAFYIDDMGFDGTSNVLGESVGFYSFFADPNNSFFGGAFSTFPGLWTLDLVNGVASLTYSGGGTPVPLPAAAWLLLSGIAGFAGLARRKAA
jgi:hypothetical protein